MAKKTQQNVTAVIELKITPAKDTGFAKIAQKIAKFPQVALPCMSCISAMWCHKA